MYHIGQKLEHLGPISISQKFVENAQCEIETFVNVGANMKDAADENVADNVISLEEQTLGENDPMVPEVGMTFNEEKKLWNFYKGYAYYVGFPVRRRNSKKGDDGKMKYVTFTCNREGRRTTSTSDSLKPQPIIQTNCKARITACSDYHGIWRINKVHLDHNHKTSPSKSKLYRCNWELSSHVKRKFEVNDMVGIPLRKNYNSIVVEAGGYENITCVENDRRNYVEQVRRLRLGEGDVASIQSYFSRM
ncbi:protein FAR-RED IMPAIRED RESPONSE 1-like [Olea europaea var. sylvestris]|uniref:protein FAR-RED IMPAIRED RESPONSE 1-like n=1 Tax=Olea europaea var. sylvestris TaxID=158386 RepID=UPI000C1CD594|nr:protein FAR-RED IMPAIRED RESPONSE 1-like [Olea europaea var. sylvestris]